MILRQMLKSKIPALNFTFNLKTKTMKKIYNAILFVIFSNALIFSAIAEEVPVTPDVEFGMFITNLHDINFSDNEFQIEFWSWFLSPKLDYLPSERTEITNSKKFSIRNANTQKFDDNYLHSQVFKGTIKKQWDIRDFPFDTQTLIISLEDTIETTDSLVFSIDETSSIANDVIPEGWRLQSFNVVAAESDYPTTFGDPRTSADTNYKFSKVEARLTLKRNGVRVFITAFLGLFVATVLMLIVYVINSTKTGLSVIPLQPRITLCVGAIFAAVGSIYSLNAKIPYTTDFTLSDSLQITTFIGIALAIISSVWSETLMKKGREKIQRKLMISIWCLFLIVHIGLNFYLINLA